MSPTPRDEERIPVNEIDTVCVECYRVTQKRYSIDCPICHGQVIHVRAGMGQQAAKELKARGTSNLAI